MSVFIDILVAAGLVLPPIIFALAAYRPASATIIWARRHPKSSTDQAGEGSIEGSVGAILHPQIDELPSEAWIVGYWS
jgi:hypothetical protein